MAENKVYDPNEVEGLVQLAQAGDIEARNELVKRFQRLIASLVQVCVTGRPNFWSSKQIKFIKLFARKGKPVENTAAMLKNKLGAYTKDELFSAGQLAAFNAIEITTSNYAETIVYCFKDIITEMIKDPINNPSFELQEEDTAVASFESTVSIAMFISGLEDQEREVALKIVEGEKVRKKDIPLSLKRKMVRYLGYNPKEK